MEPARARSRVHRDDGPAPARPSTWALHAKRGLLDILGECAATESSTRMAGGSGHSVRLNNPAAIADNEGKKMLDSSGENRPIRVLLVDDHQLLTGALSQMLSREPDIIVAGVAGTVAEAKALARERLDVVLMAYRLPDGTGAEATRAIKARWPAARVVMLTALTDDETVLESIQAGADGYLTKDRAIDEVVSAVRAAYAGETLLPRSVIVGIAQRVAAARERGTERRQIEPLTPREL